MEALSKHSTANNSVLKIIVAVLFIILPFVGFYWGMKYQSSITEVSEPPATPVRKPTPTPKQVIDETADWKTYITSDFLFKYPPVMVTETSSEPSVSYLVTSDFQPTGEAGYQIQITKVTGSIPTISQFMKIEPNTPEQTFLDKQNVETINGNQVVIKTYQGQGYWNNIKKYYVYSPKLAVLFQGTGKDHTTFDQILSTFRFTK